MERESRIDSLRQGLLYAESSLEKYHLCDVIFDEYYKWNADSAYSYAHRKASIANETGDLHLIMDSAGDLARRYIISGMYHEALYSLQAVDSSAVLSSENKGEWDDLLYEIYHGLVIVTTDKVLCDEYREKEAFYLDRCRKTLSSDMMAYYTVHAKQLILEGRFDEAINIVNDRLAKSDLSFSDLAVLNYWLASAYLAKGDKSNALLHYAVCSKYDILTTNREYVSLAMAARLCYERGDLRRAYNYIIRNYSDVVLVDAKLRQNQISSNLPIIVKAYEKREAQFRLKLMLFSISLIILLFLLAFAMKMLRRNYRRLKEANHIKNVYLGEFMAMFADHINSLEKYRSSLRVTAKQQDFDALLQELRSDDFIDAEWDYLMDKFDKTFLGLFPNFISQLNALLKPDKQVGIGLPEGTMTNQLRVYALIRMGVTKSSRIAKFLRLSSSTIYNSRVTLHNSAINKKEDIELRLMKLGN
ncbi:MAG: DUF6377 domain-containing protein [Bacteroidales bacterium]|nr:DUF6377 domain-containing protein [Bacteroidales bacterium]